MRSDASLAAEFDDRRLAVSATTYAPRLSCPGFQWSTSLPISMPLTCGQSPAAPMPRMCAAPTEASPCLRLVSITKLMFALGPAASAKARYASRSAEEMFRAHCVSSAVDPGGRGAQHDWSALSPPMRMTGPAWLP